MKVAVLTKPTIEIEMVDFVGGLDWYYENLNCRCIDIVRVGDFTMVVDDEGLLVENPKINLTASLLYGNPICGNALILKEDFNEEGEIDFVGLTKEDVSELNDLIVKLLNEIKRHR